MAPGPEREREHPDHPDPSGGDRIGVTRPDDEAPPESDDRFARSPDAAYGQREGQGDEVTEHEPDSTGGAPSPG